MEIIRYSEDLAGAWDKFVRADSRNGTVFHERCFLSYHKDRFEDCSLLAVEQPQGRILAVLPAAMVVTGDRRVLHSHPGATYGGVVYHRDLRTRALKEVIHGLLEYARSACQAQEVKLVLPEDFHTAEPAGELPFLLWHRGFFLDCKEVSSAAHLATIETLRDFGRTPRQYIRSQKDARLGIEHSEVKDEPAFNEAYELIRQNLSSRYGKNPTHTREELLALWGNLDGRVRVFLSRYQGQIAAAVVVFELNSRVVHDFYTAANLELSAMKPLFGLFMHIFRYYAGRGFAYFNFGISSRGKVIKWGILDFKEQLGGQIFTRDVWVLRDLSGGWPEPSLE